MRRVNPDVFKFYTAFGIPKIVFSKDKRPYECLQPKNVLSKKLINLASPKFYLERKVFTSSSSSQTRATSCRPTSSTRARPWTRRCTWMLHRLLWSPGWTRWPQGGRTSFNKTELRLVRPALSRTGCPPTCQCSGPRSFGLQTRRIAIRWTIMCGAFLRESPTKPIITPSTA